MGQITVQPSKLYVMQDVNWPNGGFTDGNTDLLPSSGERSIATFQDYDSVSDVYYDVHFNILAEYAPSLPANTTITGVTLNILTGNSHLTNNPNFTFYPTVFTTPSVPGAINPSAYIDAGSQLGQTSFTANQGAPNRWVAISCLGLKDNGWRFRFNSSGGSDLYFENGSGAGKNPYLVIDYVENNTAPNAPSVSISGIGSDYQPTNGTNFTVNWSINDPDAGDYQSSYQVVGSYNEFSTWHTNSGRIYDGNARSYTVDTSQAEGDWRFVVMTWDKNGASSPWGYSIHARVDRTAPAIGSIDGASNHTSTGVVRKHLYNVTDNLSGVSYADAYWNKNGGAWNGPYRANVWDNGQPGTDFWYDFPGNQGDGTINVRYWVYDAAGNGSYRDTSFNIDVTPPSAPTINRSRGDVWGNTDVTFTITNGTDNFSGVNRSEYSINGGGWTTYSSTVTISAEGTTTIQARTIDNYGNVSGVTTNYAYIDKTAPSPISSVSAQQYIKTNSATVWAYGITDGLSGINRVEVAVYTPSSSYVTTLTATKNGATNDYSVTYGSLNVDGNWSFQVNAYDNAGNLRQANAYVFRDTTLPSVASVQGYSYTNLTSGTRRVWIYGVTDASGVNYVDTQYARPGEALQGGGNAGKSGSDYYIDVPLGPQGEYYIRFFPYDMAGNVKSGGYEAYFFVDSAKANDPNPSAVWGESTAEFTWGAFNDPNPSSGRGTTDFYLGEWNGTAYVGTPLFNGGDIGDVTSKTVTGLKARTRYRYTVTYHDKSGNESAYTYREFVTKKKVGEKHIEGPGNQIIVLPIYDPASGVIGSNKRRVALAGGVIGCYELVSVNAPNASPAHIQTVDGIWAYAK